MRYVFIHCQSCGNATNRHKILKCNDCKHIYCTFCAVKDTCVQLPIPKCPKCDSDYFIILGDIKNIRNQ